MNEKRGTRLWNPAAAREWEILEEQISAEKRAECRCEYSSPTGAAGRIDERGESPGEKNERDDDQPDERADDEAEEKGEAVLFAPKVFNQVDQARGQRCDSYRWHFLKLNAVSAVPKCTALTASKVCSPALRFCYREARNQSLGIVREPDSVNAVGRFQFPGTDDIGFFVGGDYRSIDRALHVVAVH